MSALLGVGSFDAHADLVAYWHWQWEWKRKLLLDDEPELFPSVLASEFRVRYSHRDLLLEGVLYVPACDEEHADMLARRLARYLGGQTHVMRGDTVIRAYHWVDWL